MNYTRILYFIFIYVLRYQVTSDGDDTPSPLLLEDLNHLAPSLHPNQFVPQQTMQ